MLESKRLRSKWWHARRARNRERKMARIDPTRPKYMAWKRRHRDEE